MHAEAWGGGFQDGGFTQGGGESAVAGSESEKIILPVRLHDIVNADLADDKFVVGNYKFKTVSCSKTSYLFKLVNERDFSCLDSRIWSRLGDQ